MIKYLFTLLCLTSFIISSHSSASLGGYAQIGAIALESEPTLNQDKVKRDPQAKLEEKAQLLLQVPSNSAAKRKLFRLFDVADPRPFNSIMYPYSLREINILVGDGESRDVHLYAQLDRARTFMGKVALARLISEPITDIPLILCRQQALKVLIANRSKADLNASLAFLMETIGKHEKMLLNAWNPAADLDAELAKRVYFSGIFDSWNTKPHCCEVVRKFYYGGTALLAGVTCGIIGVLGWQLYNTVSAWLHYQIPGKIAAPLSALYVGCIGIDIYNIYKLKAEFETQHYIYTSLYKRMQPLAATFYAIDALYVRLQQKDAAPLRAVMQNYNQLKDFCENKNISCCLAVLKKVLMSGSFAQENGTWQERLGDAVTAYALLHKVKDELVPVMVALGSIDAYMSVASAYCQSALQPQRYVFAEFVEQGSPVLAIKGLYNPLLSGSQIKASDIYLGANKPGTLILTGPHGGGKSTYMKAIAYAVQLAQTFGIVPAEKATLTVFDKLYTYANIKEELGQGYSTFMAEKKRLDDIQKELLLSTELKTLTVIDEPLKGTMEAEGALRVERFLKQVAPLKNSILVMATHFERPAQLGKEMPASIVNAHPELVEKSTGEFVRTFTIVPGPNEWWFTDAQKRERYINWLTCVN
ncbi:hypothetical protein H0X48_05010 [Candidatus Dependentiae bacterium]|nr:hypothetical protein [Candidatus Dependentiae bacterium]